MRLLATTPEADLARLPIALDLRALSIAEGARAALAVVAIIACVEWLHFPPLLEAALGALLTCLGDSGGPIRRRLPALVAFTLLGAAMTVGFGMLRSHGLLITVPLASLAVFACAFARIWGQAPMQIGNLLVVVLVLALDEPHEGPEALVLGALFAAGCAWATLLTMVIWRIHPFRPVRRTLSDAYRSLARLVGDLAALASADAGQPAWDAHARSHRRAVRDTVERARTVVQDTLRTRGQASPRAVQALLRLETVDQLFGASVALSDLLEATPALRPAALPLLNLLRPALRTVAEIIAADDPGRRTPSAHLTLRLNELAAAAASTPALAGLTDAIAERLRIAATLSAPLGWTAGALPDPPAGTWRSRVLSPVRSNLSWHSAIFRHAARVAAVAAPALCVTLPLTGRYQHWLVITLLLTLQPFYALTWQRALERIGGTVLGGLAAAVVSLVCTTPITTAAAMAPIAVLAFALRAVNYGAFIALLTPLVVLLTEISRPGTGELEIAALRAAYTLAGGLLAVAAAFLLWPSWEPDRLARDLRDALLAHAAFAAAELDALLGDGPPTAVNRARRSAGVASNNLETTLSRALNEPRRQRNATLQSAMVADAALRRMAGRLSALQLDPHAADGITPEALRLWRVWIDTALRALAAREPAIPPRPHGPAPDTVLRIARQIELMAGLYF